MNITLFNKTYWIRRFREQEIVDGYVVATYEDFQTSLNVHPLGTDKQMALPEGERKIKRLEAHGSDKKLFTADESAGQKADMLYYDGRWYECVNSQVWDHTFLSHVNYQFVIVPLDAAGTSDLMPPSGGSGYCRFANEGWCHCK